MWVARYRIHQTGSMEKPDCQPVVDLQFRQAVPELWQTSLPTGGARGLGLHKKLPNPCAHRPIRAGKMASFRKLSVIIVAITTPAASLPRNTVSTRRARRKPMAANITQTSHVGICIKASFNTGSHSAESTTSPTAANSNHRPSRRSPINLRNTAVTISNIAIVKTVGSNMNFSRLVNHSGNSGNSFV